MNRLERYIYDLVKYNAPLKRRIVALYQLIFSVVGRLKGRVSTSLDYDVFEGCFFGFHDRLSLNKHGNLIAHKETRRFVDGAGLAQLGYFRLGDESKSFMVVAETPCCNYQQGSLATWFGDDSIIYNDFVGGSPATVIRKLDGGIERTLPFHFFSLSKKREFVTSINFFRFGKAMPGYGYNVPFGEIYEKDGASAISTSPLGDLVVYSLDDSIEKRRVSAQEAKSHSLYLMDSGYEYFSHTAFSPNASYLYFLYRSANSYRNTSQLLVLDMGTGELFALPTKGMVSHLDWLNDSTIIAYCNVVGFDQDGYYLFDLSCENYEVRRVVFEGGSADGHPHCSRQKEGVFYTDTYPNRERRQSLYAVDAMNNESKEILSVYSPRNFHGVSRVDLHPRLSECERFVTVDSSHLGKRSQLVLRL